MALRGLAEHHPCSGPEALWGLHYPEHTAQEGQCVLGNVSPMKDQDRGISMPRNPVKAGLPLAPWWQPLWFLSVAPRDRGSEPRVGVGTATPCAAPPTDALAAAAPRHPLQVNAGPSGPSQPPPRVRGACSHACSPGPVSRMVRRSWVRPSFWRCHGSWERVQVEGSAGAKAWRSGRAGRIRETRGASCVFRKL